MRFKKKILITCTLKDMYDNIGTSVRTVGRMTSEY